MLSWFTPPATDNPEPEEETTRSGFHPIDLSTIPDVPPTLSFSTPSAAQPTKREEPATAAAGRQKMNFFGGMQIVKKTATRERTTSAVDTPTMEEGTPEVRTSVSAEPASPPAYEPPRVEPAGHNPNVLESFLHDEVEESSSSSDETPRETHVPSSHVERLEKIFLQHDPSKLSQIDSILAYFRGREDELFRQLSEKYPQDHQTGGSGGASRRQSVSKGDSLPDSPNVSDVVNTAPPPPKSSFAFINSTTLPVNPGRVIHASDSVRSPMISTPATDKETPSVINTDSGGEEGEEYVTLEVEQGDAVGPLQDSLKEQLERLCLRFQENVSLLESLSKLQNEVNDKLANGDYSRVSAVQEKISSATENISRVNDTIREESNVFVPVCNKFTQQLLHLSSQLESKKARMRDTLRTTHAAQRSTLLSTLETIQNSLKKNNTRMGEIENKLEQLSQSLEDNTAKGDTLQTLLTERKTSAAVEVNRLTEEMAVQDKEIAEYEKKLALLKERRRKNARELQLLEQQYVKDTTETNHSIKEVTATVAKLKQEKDTLTNQKDLLSSEKVNFSNRLSELESAVHSQEIQHKEEEETLQDELSRLESEGKSAPALQEFFNHLREVMDLRKTVLSVLAPHEERPRGLPDAVVELFRKRRTCEEKRDAIAQEVARTERSIVEKRVELDLLETRLPNLQDQVKLLLTSKQYKDAQKKSEELQTSSQQCQTLKQSIAELEGFRQQLLQSTSDTRDQLEEVEKVLLNEKKQMMDTYKAKLALTLVPNWAADAEMETQLQSLVSVLDSELRLLEETTL
ncbi:hypothetical protein ADEAN_000913000 [Angomonas deanei]|uniref:Uncharacterized protein n=1 Tax=Angomonas deanei TaxID=59799 RepID=A0A7G2CP17_9TRYP|nr:hypothetical protein ADEAN_000913000 [Angomonas deanei]